MSNTDLEYEVNSAKAMVIDGLLSGPLDFADWASETTGICNGCGSPESTIFKPKKIPHTFLGVSFIEACMIHDWRYHKGETIEHKDSADREFMNNCLRLAELRKKPWVPMFLYKVPIRVAYKGLQRYGGPAFWAKTENNQ